MNKYFYKQFKRIFDLTVIHDELYDGLNRQLEWAITNSEKMIMEEHMHIAQIRLQAVRKQIIDNLRKELMVRIHRKVDKSMECKWLHAIVYIDDKGKQWNLHGSRLQGNMVIGQKNMIIILMKVRADVQAADINLQIELRESGDDTIALFYDMVFPSWRPTYILS